MPDRNVNCRGGGGGGGAGAGAGAGAAAGALGAAVCGLEAGRGAGGRAAGAAGAGGSAAGAGSGAGAGAGATGGAACSAGGASDERPQPNCSTLNPAVASVATNNTTVRFIMLQSFHPEESASCIDNSHAIGAHILRRRWREGKLYVTRGRRRRPRVSTSSATWTGSVWGGSASSPAACLLLSGRRCQLP